MNQINSTDFANESRNTTRIGQGQANQNTHQALDSTAQLNSNNPSSNDLDTSRGSPVARFNSCNRC